MASGFRSLIILITLTGFCKTECPSGKPPPSGNNVCSFKTSCIATFIKQVSVRKTVTYKTTCYFWLIGRSCYKSRTVYKLEDKTFTRQETRTDYRCCSGYVREGDICKPDCSSMKGCKHGRCVGPSTCSCDAGYTGSDCSLPCPADTYGDKCASTCTCLNGAVCNHITGKCTCKAGWTGERCHQQCPQGSYGMNCTNRCDCEHNASCSHVTGVCSCQVGYTGPRCNETCPKGYFGLGCDSKCPCFNNASCNFKDGTCTCTAGWRGSVCNRPCSFGKYGAGCQMTCDCVNVESCDPITGTCHCKPGFNGTRCDQKCPPGTFGSRCQSTCICNLTNSICDTSDGTCTCKAGWTGPTCSKRCGHVITLVDGNSTEVSCDQTCNCTENGKCQANTGLCKCSNGYTGDRCQNKCVPGKYGQDCTQECQCKNNATCSHINGSCTCQPGWTGTHCKEACPVGYYGMDCKLQCTCVHGLCDKATGKCTCNDEWQGKFCDTKCPKWTYGIGCKNNCTCNTTNSDSCHALTGNCSCKIGWVGDTCSKQQDCPAGFYGKNCKNTCTCVHALKCNTLDGKCICMPGYVGEKCDIKCPPRSYGTGCKYTCNCAHGSECDFVTGKCDCVAGWTGSVCNQVCPQGTYGKGCSKTCKCVNNGKCDPATGVCQCQEGWTGKTCAESCQPWFYGKGCQETCSCITNNSVSCDVVSGKCKCKAGFEGDDCELACGRGFWGDECLKVCGCSNHHSKDRFSCDPVTGNCRCNAGWTGRTCERECPPGTFGDQCSVQCPCSGEKGMTGDCEKLTGKCTCLPGYIGNSCSKTCSAGKFGVGCRYDCKCSDCSFTDGSCVAAKEKRLSPAVIAGPAVGGVIVLIFLVLLLIYILRRRSRSQLERQLQVKYQTRSQSTKTLVDDSGDVTVVNAETGEFETLDAQMKKSLDPNPIYEPSSGEKVTIGAVPGVNPIYYVKGQGNEGHVKGHVNEGYINEYDTLDHNVKPKAHVPLNPQYSHLDIKPTKLGNNDQLTSGGVYSGPAEKEGNAGIESGDTTSKRTSRAIPNNYEFIDEKLFQKPQQKPAKGLTPAPGDIVAPAPFYDRLAQSRGGTTASGSEKQPVNEMYSRLGEQPGPEAFNSPIYQSADSLKRGEYTDVIPGGGGGSTLGVDYDRLDQWRGSTLGSEGSESTLDRNEEYSRLGGPAGADTWVPQIYESADTLKLGLYDEIADKGAHLNPVAYDQLDRAASEGGTLGVNYDRLDQWRGSTLGSEESGSTLDRNEEYSRLGGPAGSDTWVPQIYESADTLKQGLYDEIADTGGHLNPVVYDQLDRAASEKQGRPRLPSLGSNYARLKDENAASEYAEPTGF